MPPQLDATDIGRLVAAHPQWWVAAGYAVPTGAPVVSRLGRGESFVVWRVEPGLAVRVPHRPLHELPRGLDAELDLLTRVPDGLAARPVAVHVPTDGDDTAYLVTTVVEGEVLAPEAWTQDLLAALARQLARLHVEGRIDGLPPADDPDPLRAAESARGWWREHQPEHAAALEPLWPAVLRHQDRARPAFAAAEQRLVHGDACLTNVVVADGVPRLIDWEWGGIGDPAHDLAFAGGAVHAHPWYAPMTEQQVRSQAEIYAAERDTLGAPVDLEPLLARRAASLVHETFFIQPHLHRVATLATDEGTRTTYREAAAQLHDGLERWIG